MWSRKSRQSDVGWEHFLQRCGSDVCENRPKLNITWLEENVDETALTATFCQSFANKTTNFTFSRNKRICLSDGDTKQESRLTPAGIPKGRRQTFQTLQSRRSNFHSRSQRPSVSRLLNKRPERKLDSSVGKSVFLIKHRNATEPSGRESKRNVTSGNQITATQSEEKLNGTRFQIYSCCFQFGMKLWWILFRLGLNVLQLFPTTDIKTFHWSLMWQTQTG